MREIMSFDPTNEEVFEVDLSGQKANSFMIPEGKYAVQLIDVEKSESQAGNPMWIWDFEVVGTEHSGFTLRSYTAITPAALWKLSETLEALGLSEGGGQLAKFSKSAAIGRRCVAIVKDSTYNEKTRSSIENLEKHPDGFEMSSGW